MRNCVPRQRVSPRRAGWCAGLLVAAACVAQCSCSSVPWVGRTPLSDPYLCDIVSADLLESSFKFRTGVLYYNYSNVGGVAGGRAAWNLRVSTKASKSSTLSIAVGAPCPGKYGHPLDELVPEEKERTYAVPASLPGHGGQGWIMDSAPQEEARVLVWQYPSGHCLVRSVRYEEGAPAPEDNVQAMQDLALQSSTRSRPLSPARTRTAPPLLVTARPEPHARAVRQAPPAQVEAANRGLIGGDGVYDPANLQDDGGMLYGWSPRRMARCGSLYRLILQEVRTCKFMTGATRSEGRILMGSWGCRFEY